MPLDDRLSDDELDVLRPWWREVGASSTKAYQIIATLVLCRDVSMPATIDAMSRNHQVRVNEFWNHDPVRPN